MKNKPKVNMASYRVLRTLQYLFEEDLTMQQLIDKLNSDNSGTYNNFVVSKYLNTCKCCGIDIQKVDGKYAIMNFPFGEKFTADETKLIYDLINCNENRKTQTINNDLITKLHLPLYKSSNGLKSSESYRLINLFEKSLVIKNEIELIYRSGEILKCKPESIKVDDGKIIFRIKKDNSIKEVSPEELADVKISNKKVKKSELGGKDVIFELRGKLAKRYQLRENELILRYKKNGDIVVINKYEDKESLFRRLSRYDYLCKIVKPLSYAKEFKTIINDTLKNYGIEKEDE